MPKLKLVGKRLTLEATPVPLRLTVCGLPVALSMIVIVPAWAPVAVGVNVTLIEQFPPAATELPQVFVWAYCALAAILVTLSAALPPLVSVTVCAALVVPTSWLAKVRLVEERLTLALPPPKALYAVRISIVVMEELKVGW